MARIYLDRRDLYLPGQYTFFVTPPPGSTRVEIGVSRNETWDKLTDKRSVEVRAFVTHHPKRPKWHFLVGFTAGPGKGECSSVGKKFKAPESITHEYAKELMVELTISEQIKTDVFVEFT